MSSIEAVTVPRWGMTMTEGTITEWLVAEGAIIDRGQEILEIETTKVSNVVESPASGTLRRIVLQSGVTAPVGALAGVLADITATEQDIDAFVESYANRLGADGGDQASVGAARTIEIDGGSVNILEMGGGDGITAIFLHGFGGDLTTWLFNQEAIAEMGRAIAIDLPGHGMSSPVVGGDVTARIVRAVKATIDEVAPGPVHLIGHSFGGAIAAAVAALAAPTSLASLTLIAPIGLGKDINRAFLTDFIAAERRRPLLNALSNLFSDPSKITSDMVEGTLRFKRLEGVTEALTAIADAIAGEAGQLQSIGGTLEKLDCPVMLIWGEQDAIIPLPDKASLPATVDLRIIEGVGHMPQMEAASAVNDAIRENIDRAR